jgi:hypothetical protein
MAKRMDGLGPWGWALTPTLKIHIYIYKITKTCFRTYPNKISMWVTVEVGRAMTDKKILVS